jgi:hypothetical protein
MAKYFNFFPKTPYYIDKEKRSVDLLTNLTTKFKFNDDFKENTVIYYDYDLVDGETPEIIADKIYNSPERHWIILLLNDIVNPFTDWPMQYNSLVKFIDQKYTSNADTANNETGLEWAQSNYKIYQLKETKTVITTGVKTENIIFLTEQSYANTINFQSNYTLEDGTEIELTKIKEQISYYDYEINENESKRTIKLLRNEFIPLLEEEFKRVLR